MLQIARSPQTCSAAPSIICGWTLDHEYFAPQMKRPHYLYLSSNHEYINHELTKYCWSEPQIFWPPKITCCTVLCAFLWTNNYEVNAGKWKIYRKIEVSQWLLLTVQLSSSLDISVVLNNWKSLLLFGLLKSVAGRYKKVEAWHERTTFLWRALLDLV